MKKLSIFELQIEKHYAYKKCIQNHKDPILNQQKVLPLSLATISLLIYENQRHSHGKFDKLVHTSQKQYRQIFQTTTGKFQNDFLFHINSMIPSCAGSSLLRSVNFKETKQWPKEIHRKFPSKPFNNIHSYASILTSEIRFVNLKIMPLICFAIQFTSIKSLNIDKLLS